jgi:5-methyltetrahydropteroyltriglutamate--homocysteine methyltransferase
MPRSTANGPYRADHVGSFIRPDALLDIRKKRQAGTIPTAELRAAEDEAIREIVKMQEDAGLRSITDGEFRRFSWNKDFLTGFDNVREIEGRLQVYHRQADGTDSKLTPTGIAVDGKLKRSRGIQIEDFKFLQSVTKRTVKVCIPSPTLMHFRGGREAISRDAYPDMQAFYADLARVYNEEILALAALGCRYLQIDDTNFAYLCDPRFREASKRLGEDPNALPETYCRLINDTLRNIPDDMTIGLHICRGNATRGGAATGGYEPVAEVVFNRLKVHALFLEFDDERSGGFEPLRFTPGDKTVVLGLMSTKRPELEPQDVLRRRIDEAAKYVPLERLALSPQCGFASGIVYRRDLTIDNQKAKLRLLVDTARKVWADA